MAEIHSEYDGSYLSPEQIEALDAGLTADLDAMAAPDPDPEAGADAEAEAG